MHPGCYQNNKNMIELNEIQKRYNANRQEQDIVSKKLQHAKAEMGELVVAEEKELRGLGIQLREERKRHYAEEKNRLANAIKELSGKKRDLNRDFGNFSVDFFTSLDPAKLITDLNDTFPILLFPLRLEIRFKSTGTQPQLWLRVYPDDCNINNREDLLSESEITNAKTFWTGTWKAGGVVLEEKAAWRTLVNNHGSGRAAWIIREFKPTNTRPTKPDASHKILVTTSALSLSSLELEKAKDYWIDVWLARNDASKISLAFTTLQNAIGTARADEVRKDFVPVNITD